MIPSQQNQDTHLLDVQNAQVAPDKKILPAASKEAKWSWPEELLLQGCLLTAGGARPARGRVGSVKGDLKNCKGEQVTSQAAKNYVRLPVGHRLHLNTGILNAGVNENIHSDNVIHPITFTYTSNENLC